jgi:hypothetical protein
LKKEDEDRIATEAREQLLEVQAIDQEWRTQQIEDQKQYVADAQKNFDSMADQLEFYNFKLSIKQTLRKSLTDESALEENQRDIDEAQQGVRDIQMGIGYDKQHLQQQQNELRRLQNEDKEIKSSISFETDNLKLQKDRANADRDYNDAVAVKTSAEAKITTLEDLKFETDDQAILDQLDGRITELQEAIVVAEATILQTQADFNTFAEEELAIKIQREIDLEQAEKNRNFLAAESRYNEFKSIIDDINARLKDFTATEEPADGDDKKDDEKDKEEKELPACAPQYMYELDWSMAEPIPQVSW